jgi:hypothetical protein
VVQRISSLAVDLFKAAIARQSLRSATVEAGVTGRAPRGASPGCVFGWHAPRVHCVQISAVWQPPVWAASRVPRGCAMGMPWACVSVAHKCHTCVVVVRVCVWVRARACWNAAAREPGAAPVVVIVGAGFCGLGVLKALQQQEGPSHVHVVLIDKKDYFEFSPFLVSRISACGLVTVRPAPAPSHTQLLGRNHKHEGCRCPTAVDFLVAGFPAGVSALRMCACVCAVWLCTLWACRAAGARPGGKAGGAMWVPLKALCPSAELVVGKVRAVTPTYVEVGYRRIGFDYLVLASGAKVAGDLRSCGATAAGRAAGLDLDAQQLAAPSMARVLVAGSGLAAVEFAALLKGAWPTKRVRPPPSMPTALVVTVAVVLVVVVCLCEGGGLYRGAVGWRLNTDWNGTLCCGRLG